MSIKNPIGAARVNTLFTRVSATFLIILLILAAVYVIISVRTAQRYYDEINQRLNRTIAKHITHELPPIVNGAVNETALKQLFHNAMVLNPHLEIYLLDKEGTILTYSAPDSIILQRSIPIAVIERFLRDSVRQVHLGPDPRNINSRKAFSAYPVYEGNHLAGYVYVILASQVFESVAHSIVGSYMLRLSVNTMIITFIAALLTGLMAIWYLTRSFREIMAVIQQFRAGNFSARMKSRGKGSFAMLAGTFNDMAERVEQHVGMISSIEKTRRQLIASISHDLRTPLATIQGYVETLTMKKDSIDDDEQTRYLEIVLHGTRRLQQLVEDLFELSQLEARETPMDIEPFSLADIVQDNFASQRIGSKKKEVSLDADIDPDLPLVRGDIRYIDRVVQNLLDNAIKFCGPKGKVLVNLSRRNGHVLFKILNDGPGIAAEDIPHLFDPYRTGSHSRFQHPDNENSSTGLGLAIVKQILKLHHSDITVESTPGIETVFEFMLPAEASPV